MDMIFKTEYYTEIEKTLCEYFDISKPVLEKTAIQYINDYDKLTNVTITSLYDWFVAKFPTDNHITQVEFYHLTRRLKTSTGDYSIQNLQTLLISNKNFTDFLNKYDISFAKKGESINLLYKNKLFNFDDELLRLIMIQNILQTKNKIRSSMALLFLSELKKLNTMKAYNRHPK